MYFKHICYMQEYWHGVQLCGVNLRLYKVKRIIWKNASFGEWGTERNKKVKNLFARLKWTSVNLILQFFHQTCLFNAQRKKSLRTYKNSLETGHFHLKFNSEKKLGISFVFLFTYILDKMSIDKLPGINYAIKLAVRRDANTQHNIQ